jgi:hypothetical protein
MCRLLQLATRGKNYRYRTSVKSQHKARRTCDLQCYFVAESFPYVPHTCYLRPACRPKAGDCAQYARLRACCCDYLTAKKCKYSQLLTTHFSVYTIPLTGTALQPCEFYRSISRTVVAISYAMTRAGRHYKSTVFSFTYVVIK